MKLSVILPVYNTYKYLDKCLKSILDSTYTDYELIVLNDGTKDDSESIILNYKDKFDGRMKYIKKENTGLSDTRNLGIKEAKGEYIIFLDSDDYIEKDMFLLLIQKIEENDFDMVACDLNIVYEDSIKTKCISSGYEEDLSLQEKIKGSMIKYYPAVWNKIYKTDIVKKIKFTPNVWYEDMEFMLKLYPNIKSIGVVKKPLYNYLQRKNSITYTYNEKLLDIVTNMDRVVDYYKQNNIYYEYESELEYLYARYLFATFPKRLAKIKNKKEYDKQIINVINKVNTLFPNYKKNIYLNSTGIKGKYIKHFNKLFASLNYMLEQSKKYN